MNTMAETLGYDVVEAATGRVIVTATPNGAHLNPNGMVHGMHPVKALRARTVLMKHHVLL
jgi:hypothetical protein